MPRSCSTQSHVQELKECKSVFFLFRWKWVISGVISSEHTNPEPSIVSELRILGFRGFTVSRVQELRVLELIV